MRAAARVQGSRFRVYGLKVQGSGLMVPGFSIDDLRVQGSGLMVSGLRVHGRWSQGSGFGVDGLKVQGSGLMVSGCRVQGAGFWVQGAGLMVSGFKVRGAGFPLGPPEDPHAAYLMRTSSSASLGSTDSFGVDMRGVRYKSLIFGAEKGLGQPDWSAQTYGDRARTSRPASSQLSVIQP